MLDLTPFKSTKTQVPDLFPWAALVDNGVVQNKDGSLMAGWYYRGEDIASSTPQRRNHIAERVNAALSRFGSGWATWIDAIRLPSTAYPKASSSHFPDPVTALIDEERRRQFHEAGAHYESVYVLVVQYTPPLRRENRVVELIYDQDASAARGPADIILAWFKRAIEDAEDSIGDAVALQRMGAYHVDDAEGRRHMRDNLVDYFSYCVTGDLVSINMPRHGMYLDGVIGGQDFYPGVEHLKIGDNFVACVAIQGFPAESYPGILSILDQLPVHYRWSTRMIYLDQHDTLAELNRYHRTWKQKKRGFFAQVFKTEGGTIDEDALLMSEQAETSIGDANSGIVTFGYYTPVVVLMGPDKAELSENARVVVREVRRLGFQARVEEANTIEAWLGSLPGNTIPNVRRPLVHTLCLSDLLPLSSVWSGHETNPNPMYGKGAPPLLHGRTSGSTPFRLNLHVDDVGHTLVFGPTGSGKSTLLCTTALQFRRYKGAKIFSIDKGMSMFAAAMACRGVHYALGSDDGSSPMLCPLADIDGTSALAEAEEWIAECFFLQMDRQPDSEEKREIREALERMKANGARRSVTDFCNEVQNVPVRDAMRYYRLLGGTAGHLLDGTSDGVEASHFTVFEIDTLMTMGEKTVIPVLRHLFRVFERSLDGKPALLLLDEAWVVFKHPVFVEKVQQWIRELRKKNCAVVFATQSLADATKSPIFSALVENCPTKIYLPNDEADVEGTAEHPGPYNLYKSLGMNDTQIEILRTSVRKKDYYYASPEGRRLFDLGLGPVALAFAGVSSKDDVDRVRHLMALKGDAWPAAWLEERKGPRWAVDALRAAYGQEAAANDAKEDAHAEAA